ncbi:MAG: GTP-binding protein [Alphaproteobacteria bacterium]|nr:GTP-binding protein [Alphaproteobacteria bacterium]
MDLIPVTVLTGCLGASKTTLLNRILTEERDRKYDVVVNEFGEIGIDNDFVVNADEEEFEMNNDCICCTVRGDLIRFLGSLMKRQGGFDGIPIETTGLADPAPVARNFLVDEDVRGRTRLGSIMTVVDACHVIQRLEDSHETLEEVAFVDIIRLDKTDLVSADELARKKSCIRSINATAVIRRTHRCEVGLDTVLERRAFDLDRIPAIEPDFGAEDDHEHDDAVKSVFLRADRPLDGNRPTKRLQRLFVERGQDLLRTTGVLSFPGHEKQYVVQAVHMLLAGNFTKSGSPDENRERRLSFIGRNIDELDLRQQYKACVA